MAALAQEPTTCEAEVLQTDSDGDGLPDAFERLFETDPLRTDSDGDGLDDGFEILVLRTSPVARDTDGDGACDGGIVAGCEFGEDLDGDGNITLEEGDPRCPDVAAAEDEVGGSRVGCAAGDGAIAAWWFALWCPLWRRRPRARNG